MDVNKLPRWVLIAGFSGFMLLGSLTLRGAFADLEQTKDVAYDAKRDIINLKSSIEEIQLSQRSFSDKYDRNQEENQKVFRQILIAVKQ